MTAPAQGCGLDPVCYSANSLLQGIADEVARSASELLVSATTWWLRTDSVNPLDPAVVSAQGVTRSVALVVMVASILIQAIRLMVSRKGEPLVLVATGLIRFAVVSALGLAVLQGALRAGDAIAVEVLDNAAVKFAAVMRNVLVLGFGGGFAVLLVSLVTAVLALVQWVLMALRQGGLLVLAAMLPLAASGSLTRATRGWLDRLMVWLIALVAYKPAAAFIYYIGFSYLASQNPNPRDRLGTMVTGLMVLILAVIALPVLLKFFAWSGTQVGGNGGSGSALLAAAGAIAQAAALGAGRGAVDRAAQMESDGPGSRSTATGAGAAGAAASAAGTAGAAAGVAAAFAASDAAARVVRGAGEAMSGQPPQNGGQQ